MKIVCDFNETLILERFLPAWCRFRMTSGSPVERVAAVARCGLLGSLSLSADRIGAGTFATWVGFQAFRGSRVSDLEEWAEAKLSPNPRAHEILTRLAAESPGASLTVVSRGTPKIAVDAYLAAEKTQKFLWQLSLAAPVTVIAPELEIEGGRITGVIRGPIVAKAARVELLGDGVVYVGDHRDQAWLDRLDGDAIRFERV